MNQRLVDSIAQIILSMTADERQLLDDKLSTDGSRQLPESDDNEKSLRIAELAQEIHEFEERYHTPLSELPADRWAVPSPSADGSPTAGADNATNGVGKSPGNGAGSSPGSLLPSALGAGVLGTPPDMQIADNGSSQPLSSFIPLTQLTSEENAENGHDRYTFYDVPGQNGHHQD